MKLGETTQRTIISSGGVEFVLLDTGNIEAIKHQHTNIHLLTGSTIEGQASNLYLRVKDSGKYHFTPLIGGSSPSRFGVKDNQVLYVGEFKGVQYNVRLTVLEYMWFWDVNLSNTTNRELTVDVFYGQDVSLSGGGNPAYICQYIDHKAFKKEDNYILCSRQNLGTPHFLEIGSITPTVGYSTDGFQFFGLDYKLTNIPEALTNEILANEVYQYEFAYLALQSESINLTANETENVVFYGAYEDKMDGVTTEAQFYEAAKETYETLEEVAITAEQKVSLAIDPNILVQVQSIDEELINQQYRERIHEERDENGQLLSFFTPEGIHVVLKEKEQIVERPHGNLLISGNYIPRKDNQFATTTYMYGVFNGHIVVGNTDMNSLTSDSQNPLNVLKLTGQRIFVKEGDAYQLLGVPSLYEMGPNYTKWIYRLENDWIEVTTIVPVDSPQAILHVSSKTTRSFIVTNDMIFAHQQFDVEKQDNSLIFTSRENTLVNDTHPELYYKLIVDREFTVQNDRVFYQDEQSRKQNLVVLTLDEVSSFTITTQGCLYGETLEDVPYDFEQLKQDYLTYIKEDVLKNFNLSFEHDNKEIVQRLNTIAIWFTQNMAIHYTSPHGLEQFSGAAWGTRDVCQGPAEFFLATGHFDEVRDILLTVYSHQFIQDGDWPQWFMFDRYEHIFANESHGDIIVWPLHLLGVYLEKTQDFAILDEEIPYLDRDARRKTTEKETLLQHVKRQVQTMKDRLIPNTHLPIYGGGDWNDSLQPANESLKERMVSGWTVSLMKEALERFSRVVEEKDGQFSKDLASFVEGITNDYHTHVVKNDVPAGFLIFTDDDVEYVLHPEDQKTGLKYRLLPIYQGILAQLFSKEQVEKYIQIINEHLRHPDGVRLMNDTVEYKGGTQSVFQRVETATNFGREIGLLYMHAHIRYMEAMAKLGRAGDAWWASEVVNPINIKDVVPNALPRQANTYFSSSDGNFKTRYEAKERFHQLRTGEVGVKAGWRVYSSGPGLYLSILIQRILGIDIRTGGVLIDPVLPKKFDGLSFHYQINGKPVTLKYHITKEAGVEKLVLNGEDLDVKQIANPYRDGGVWLNQDVLSKLKEDNNHIDIYL